MCLNIMIKWLISTFNPQYQLTLSDIIRSHEPYKTKYIFKQYGSHDFVSLTFKDIESNNNIIRVINPKNIIQMHLNELSIKKDYETYHIVEEARNNKFKIKNKYERAVFSGEYIYNNIDMFQNISTTDLCKIIYNTGFEKGRKVSLAMKSASKFEDINKSSNYKNNGNIIELKIPK